jgi:hypothetical protein
MTVKPDIQLPEALERKGKVTLRRCTLRMRVITCIQMPQSSKKKQKNPTKIEGAIQDGDK